MTPADSSDPTVAEMNLAAAAITFFAQNGFNDHTFPLLRDRVVVISVRGGKDDNTLSSPPPAEEPMAPFYFSPLELDCLKTIAAKATCKGGTIGKAVRQVDPGGQANSGLRVILKNLIDRGILETNDEGYSLSTSFALVWSALFPVEKNTSIL